MKTVLLLSVFALTPLSSFAHGDHPPRVAACIAKDCTKDQIEKALPTALDILVLQGVIDESWKLIKPASIEEKKFKKSTDWVAKYIDAKQKDEKKKNLYIFITQKGILGGANYTGE